MIENLNKIVDFIAVNYLLIFGVYSILFFLFKTFYNNKTELIEFDQSAIKLTIWIGTIWITLKLTGVVLFMLQMKKESEPEVFSQHLSWFIGSSWFQLLFWIILSQSLRIKFVNGNLIPRLLVGFFFAFSFNRISLVLANYHQYDILETVVRLIAKALIFVLVISVFHFGKRGIKNILQQRV